ncbi:trigger factor [Chitinophaga caeni]|uniref:Trigger factor n=1 Tax=Chitinophaga caeni TaxID=2029983 RepID=A0A291QTC9_9BACT|nr:trigger factor [Chitinophaga caeni]ATL47132.1 trigger factor [Chitinophaga caeni]
MATVTRENIGLLNDKITVKVSQEDYLPNFEKALKQFSKSANIPGFRKGMVPVGMVKKMSGQAIMTDEVLKSVEKGLMEFIQTEKLDIFGQPISLDQTSQKIDVNQPAEYTFDFEIGLKPVIDITPLDGNTTLTKYKITVTDAMVDDELNRLQLKGGKAEEVESITSEDDVLNVSFEAANDKGEVAEGTEKKETSVLLKYFTPAIQEQLKGKKVGDSISFKLSDAFDAERQAFILKDLKLDEAAVNDHFKVTITKINHIQKRELNEEFFAEVYPNQEITTEEAFRAKLKEEIAKYWEVEARNNLHNELFETLVHETPIELPADFLKRWLQIGGEKPKTAEEAEQEYPGFDHQLRWTLISDKLIRDNGIEVSFEEVKENAKQRIMAYFGGAAEGAEWMDSYIDNMLKDEKFVDQTYREMITTKLFDFAETKVSVKEEEITAEEFVKLPHKHHHHEH